MSCRLLSEMDDVVALSEPLQLADFEDAGSADVAVDLIERRFEEIRSRVLATGSAPSLQDAGQLGDQRVEPQAASTGLRRPLARPGAVSVDKPLSDDFHLVIKQNAVFAALLHLLSARLKCFGLIRNPLAVLASWQTVDLPVNRGRVPGAERYDRHLADRLDAEPERLQRQLMVLDWFFERFRACLPADRIVRYESIIDSGGEVLAGLLGVEHFSPQGLQRHALRERFPGLALDTLCEKVLAYPGAWRHYYSAAECSSIIEG
jgi:hypothetical protein